MVTPSSAATKSHSQGGAGEAEAQKYREKAALVESEFRKLGMKFLGLQQQVLKKDRLVKEQEHAISKLKAATKEFALKMHADMKALKKANAHLQARLNADADRTPAPLVDAQASDAIAEKERVIAEKDAALAKLKDGVKEYTVKVQDKLQNEQAKRKDAEKTTKRLSKELQLLKQSHENLQQKCAEYQERHSKPGLDSACGGVDSTPMDNPLDDILSEADRLAALDLSDVQALSLAFRGEQGANFREQGADSNPRSSVANTLSDTSIVSTRHQEAGSGSGSGSGELAAAAAGGLDEGVLVGQQQKEEAIGAAATAAAAESNATDTDTSSTDDTSRGTRGTTGSIYSTEDPDLDLVQRENEIMSRLMSVSERGTKGVSE